MCLLKWKIMKEHPSIRRPSVYTDWSSSIVIWVSGERDQPRWLGPDAAVPQCEPILFRFYFLCCAHRSLCFSFSYFDEYVSTIIRLCVSFITRSVFVPVPVHFWSAFLHFMSFCLIEILLLLLILIFSSYSKQTQVLENKTWSILWLWNKLLLRSRKISESKKQHLKFLF